MKGLLTRWREKVYELLVRRKLQEIEDIEHKQGVHKKVSPKLHIRLSAALLMNCEMDGVNLRIYCNKKLNWSGVSISVAGDSSC